MLSGVTSLCYFGNTEGESKWPIVSLRTFAATCLRHLVA